MIFSVCLLSFFVVTWPGFSQQVPEKAKAGVVEKEVKEQKIRRKAGQEVFSDAEISLPKEEAQIPEGETFLVRGFLYKGNTVLSDCRLNRIIYKYLDKNLSVKDLKDICQLISDTYKKKGYFLTSAYLPVQEIKSGIVTIEIVEGRLGEVKIEGEKHYAEKFIRKNFHPGPKGVINYDSILKSLLILNEYHNLNVKAQFKKGAAPNTVDAVLNVEDKLPLQTVIDYNNFGSDYVSRHRTGITLEYTNLALGGDTIAFRTVTGSPAKGLFFAKTDYSFPINTRGTRLSLSYLRSDFDVGREFRNLDAGGKSKIYSCDFIHPAVRTHLAHLDVNFGFDYKQIENCILGVVASDDQLRIFRAGFDYNLLDKFGGRSYLSSFVSGGIDGTMGASKKNDPLASRVGAGSEFVKANFDMARFQQFIWGSFIFLKGSYQIASDVLPISEQVSLGGPYSVRGFPYSEYLGDSGCCLNFELRFPPPFVAEKNIPFTSHAFKDKVHLLGFLDWGAASLRNPVAGDSKDYEISGTGIGARISFTSDFDLRLDMGFPVGGKEPSDGSNSTFYIHALKKF